MSDDIVSKLVHFIWRGLHARDSGHREDARLCGVPELFEKSSGHYDSPSDTRTGASDIF